jgi:carboxylate-amine ligase
LVEEIIGLVHQDAIELGCADAVDSARGIVAAGTSADRQLAIYRASLDSGKEPQDALRDVVDELIKDTRTGL